MHPESITSKTLERIKMRQCKICNCQVHLGWNNLNWTAHVSGGTHKLSANQAGVRSFWASNGEQFARTIAALFRTLEIEWLSLFESDWKAFVSQRDIFGQWDHDMRCQIHAVILPSGRDDQAIVSLWILLQEKCKKLHNELVLDRMRIILSEVFRARDVVSNVLVFLGDNALKDKEERSE